MCVQQAWTQTGVTVGLGGAVKCVLDIMKQNMKLSSKVRMLCHRDRNVLSGVIRALSSKWGRSLR